MDLSVLKDPALYRFLLAIDAELEEQVRKQGCYDCGGKLHEGGFDRKPRGCPQRFLSKAFCRRTSLDCSRCRSRNLTPSVRFLGPKTYIAAVLVLVSARGCPSASMLSTALGVPVRTVDRWRHWWRTEFVKMPLWQALKGRFLPTIDAQTLPLSLLSRLRARTSIQRLGRLLKLLSPLSAPSRTFVA